MTNAEIAYAAAAAALNRKHLDYIAEVANPNMRGWVNGSSQNVVKSFVAAAAHHANLFLDGIEERERWKTAVLDALVVSWTLNAENENDPRRAINDLECQAVAWALDPAISKDARDLIELGRTKSE